MNPLSLVPYKRLVLRTNLPAPVVVERLRLAVEAPRLFRQRGNAKPFEGKVEGNEFKFSRILIGNRFRPVLVGRVVARGEGVELSVLLRPKHSAVVFWAVWSTGLLLFELVALRATSRSGRPDLVMRIGPIGMLIFAWVSVIASFRSEAMKTERLVRDLIDALPAE